MNAWTNAFDQLKLRPHSTQSLTVSSAISLNNLPISDTDEELYQTSPTLSVSTTNARYTNNNTNVNLGFDSEEHIEMNTRIQMMFVGIHKEDVVLSRNQCGVVKDSVMKGTLYLTQNNILFQSLEFKVASRSK